MSEIMVRPCTEPVPVAETPAVAKTVSRRDERGLVSAEWVLGIVAAAALAGVLLSIVTSGPVEESLVKVVLDIIGRLTGLLK
jgi:small neutral amino acid transporter SnatA (MarC family)